MEGRECTKCFKFKPWSSYNKSKSGKNGHYSQCKECTNTLNKKWRDKAIKDGYFVNYYKNNAEKIKSIVVKHLDNQPGGVYLISTTIGRYVGQSQNMTHRVCDHMIPSNFKSPVTKENFIEWEVLEYIEDKEYRLQRERYYINKLKPELNLL